jgi:hypothetical protein
LMDLSGIANQHCYEAIGRRGDVAQDHEHDRRQASPSLETIGAQVRPRCDRPV